MQSSTDPFATHHLVIKRPSQFDDATTSKRSKPDEEIVSSNVTSTSELADKEIGTEKRSSIHLESQPEVWVCFL